MLAHHSTSSPMWRYTAWWICVSSSRQPSTLACTPVMSSSCDSEKSVVMWGCVRGAPSAGDGGGAAAGPLRTLAGAGTGKTNTLAPRVAHLILEGANPQRILLLTFSRRAALEMTRRAQRIVGELATQVRLPWSGTFHSIANRLIRRHCTRVGLQPNFSVLDRGDAADLTDLVRHELRSSK